MDPPATVFARVPKLPASVGTLIDRAPPVTVTVASVVSADAGDPILRINRAEVARVELTTSSGRVRIVAFKAGVGQDAESDALHELIDIQTTKSDSAKSSTSRAPFQLVILACHTWLSVYLPPVSEPVRFPASWAPALLGVVRCPMNQQ